MNEENLKIGMYTENEIFDYMTEQEGGMLGRSMYDAIFDKIHKLITENKQLKEQLQQKEEEIKELCKKIKVNEKSRRKMQKSLMEKIQEIEKARKEAITYIKNNLGRKCYFNKEENRYKTNESKVLEILDIEKSDK